MKKEVKKQIGVLRVGNPVGLLARKSWNVLLLNAFDDLLVKNEHEIPVSVLSNVVGYNSEDQEALKTSLKKLQTTLVEWDVGGQSKRKGVSFSNFTSVQMLGGVKIENGIVKYDFSPMLKEILHNPLIYQKINILQQKVFKTSYAHCLWENCLRYVNVGSTGFSPLEEWRKLLGATSKTYNEFKNFKRFVLSPAIKETNDLSNINVVLQTKKTGRKITDLCFLVEYKKQEQLPMIEGIDEIKNSKEYKGLISYGIANIQAITFIQEFGFKYINDKLKHIRNLEKTNYHFKISKSGFLIYAIEKDWKDDKQIDVNIQEIRKEREKEIKEKEKIIENINKKKMKEERIELFLVLEKINFQELKHKIKDVINSGALAKTTKGIMELELLKNAKTFDDLKNGVLASSNVNASYTIKKLKQEFLK